MDGDFVIRHVFKHAQGKSGDFKHVGVSAACINRAGKPGVGHAHGLLLIVPESASQDKILSVQPAVVQRMIDGVEHLRGTRFVARQAAQDTADQRGIQRCRSAFAAYVSNNDAGTRQSVIKKIV